MPIRLTTTINPNGSHNNLYQIRIHLFVTATKRFIANNPWTNNTNIRKYHGTTGDTTAYSVRNQIIIDTDPLSETKEYKCSDFVVNCPHAAEGTVSVNIKASNAQTETKAKRPSSPVRAVCDNSAVDQSRQ
jgi:hypothetical protein